MSALDTSSNAGAKAVDESSTYGGSAEAIQYHYDVSREFYKLWLDSSMTYSCALFDAEDDLPRAQARKIDYHLQQSRANQAESILDVGCGWGALLKAATQFSSIQRATGLTLSEDQAAYLRELNLPNTDIRLENWADHQPEQPYDAIVSVGAFEHFVTPENSINEKVDIYRDFFSKCRSWLSTDGRMSLQSIAYGSMKREEASAFINNEIFPASDLPRLDEIARAADGIFEIVQVFNHRLHYARTFETWAQNLRARRSEALDLVGEEVVKRYAQYLKQSSMGFYMGKLALYRVTLRPLSDRWKTMAQA